MLTAARYPHPYQIEIEQSTFLPKTHQRLEAIDFQPFNDTQAVFVDTEEGVLSMLDELKTVDEIAVDLEHHDMHSYVGLVCLMQISTRKKDWVVDTLKPWREKLQVLNEVFANPRILKVFHGSSMDMIWLQRDLGLYVVGLFDTYHAAMALNLPRKGLQHLLHQFAGVDVSKQYQLSDWRIRPIPPAMFDYARSDTHYLLYAYDRIRNLLIDHSTPEHNLIDYVLEQSKKEALQKYERSVYDAEGGLGAGGWYTLLERTSSLLNKQQFAVFRAVHQWRDTVARTEDEGPALVMNRLTLFNIAQAMPTNKSALLSAATSLSRFVNDRSEELLEVVRQAKEAGVSGPTVRDVIRQRDVKYPPRASTNAAQFQNPELPAEIPASQSVLMPVGEGDSLAARSLISHFWGQTLQDAITGTGAADSVTAAADAYHLILPLPPVFETISDPLKLSNLNGRLPAFATRSREPESSQNDDVFIAKEMGRPPKRKSHPPSQHAGLSAPDAVNGNHDHVALDGDETDPSGLSKAERKALHREQKRRKLEQRAEQFEAPGGEMAADTAPFDYSTAESILHPKPRTNEKVRDEKIFDPYSKALNAPKGMKRQRKEAPGKSFTFKH